MNDIQDHHPQPVRQRMLLWGILLPVGVLLPCLACALLLAVADQSAVEATVYVQAVSYGNEGLAELLGDHLSPDSEWHQRFYRQDVQRDMAWLAGKEVDAVSTRRELTLSGQEATVVRFRWRERGTNQAWGDAAVRVKTGRWFLLTYVTAVEQMEP